MRGKVLALLLTIILAFSFLGWYIYNQYAAPVRQREIPNLKITDLSVNQPFTMVWGAVSWTFNVTIQNFENQSHSDVTLEVLASHSETGGLFWNYTVSIGTLEAGEIRTVKGNASTNMDAFFAYTEGNVSYDASLVLGTLILDEWNAREPSH